MSYDERSHEKIADDVRMFRESLGYTPDERVYGPDVLARFIQRHPNVRIQQVSEEELFSSEAQAIPQANLIKIRASTYHALRQGNPRAGMTIVHEIGHLLYRHDGALNRSSVKGSLTSKMAAQEREASQFAAEFYAPTEASLHCSSPQELMTRFGLSLEAAKVRWDQIERVRRRRTGVPRLIPQVTKALMDDLFAKNRYKSKYPELVPDVPAPKQPALFAEHVKAREAKIQGYSPYPCPECGRYSVVQGSGCETCDCGYTSCD